MAKKRRVVKTKQTIRVVVKPGQKSAQAKVVGQKPGSGFFVKTTKAIVENSNNND